MKKLFSEILKLSLSATIGIFAALSHPVDAQFLVDEYELSHSSSSDHRHDSEHLAHGLILNFWQDVQNKDYDALEIKISDIFVGGRTQPDPSAVFDKNEKIAHLIRTTLTSFNITDVNANISRDHRVLTASYLLQEQGSYLGNSGPISFNTISRVFETWKKVEHDKGYRWHLVQSAIVVLPLG